MKSIFIVSILVIGLSSCSVYKKFSEPDVNVKGLYRDTIANTPASDTVHFMGVLKWRELFSDTLLQKLIEQGLAQNADLNMALSRIEQAEASLSSARLAYLPGLGFSSINGAVAKWNDNTTKAYAFPLSASWQLPLFGGLRNAKLKAKATLAQTQAAKKAVQSQLIASIANSYYSLLKIDKQLEIMDATIELWGQTLETMRSMKEIGITNEAGITQSEANYRSVLLSKLSLQQAQRELENALCVILGQAPQAIKLGSINELDIPEEYSAGVPLQMSANRPDVQMAEQNLAAAFYASNVARTAFYPNINITGALSWTNNAGSYIVNPAKGLTSIAGAITAPIFNRGMNRANLNIAKETQKQSLINFNQTLINAGTEVSNALFQYKTATAKEVERNKQIELLEYSEKYTRELFHLSSSTYLEVLTAQQNLLSAQISKTEDTYDKITAIIKLYQALGGGGE
ncbi:TolC family protein [Geofilum sp. OHC36d9]|uniref:TolC family protein n=1 Tax=Geofilum sp. OHC36d9 TaxID=3458413 RepID=UPI004033BE6B